MIRLALLCALLLAGEAAAGDRFIIVQSTTSTRNSGLFDRILPIFRAKTGIEARIVAVGTGQAIRNAARGDGDVLLVHDRAAEEKFVADGHGTARFDAMYNDFVIVGPPADPAGVAGTRDAAAALASIARARAVFASRGDDSGTHKAELRLWRAAGIDARAHSGRWYRETGSGMGAIEAKSGATVASDWFDSLNRVAKELPGITTRAVVYGGAERQSRRDGDVVPLIGLSGMLGRMEDRKET